VAADPAASIAIDGAEVLAGKPSFAEERGVALTGEVRSAIERLGADGKTVVVVARAGRAVGAIALEDTPRRGAERDKSLEKQFGVELILADGTVHPHKGRLDAVERAVDPTTGTLTGQFSFPNPERILRPSQYGRARFVTEVKQGASLVPQLAVQEIQGLYSVMVVKPDATVEQRMVKAGERFGNLWVIESGLKPGEKVIVEGIQKVRPGVKVSAKTVKLEEETSPAPSAPPAESKAKGAEGK
jgi:multidrug efflux pump subunit AcrA (membrane-fusion protein)